MEQIEGEGTKGHSCGGRSHAHAVPANREHIGQALCLPSFSKPSSGNVAGFAELIEGEA